MAMQMDVVSIIRQSGSPPNSAFKNLTAYAENLAKENGMTAVRIEFGPVFNIRLRTSPQWTQEYGYHFSSHTDKWGTTDYGM